MSRPYSLFSYIHSHSFTRLYPKIFKSTHICIITHAAHTHTYIGRCDFEPRYCRQMASLLLCKMPDFRELAEPCCKSCPAQATPIPLLVRGATPPTTQAPSVAPTIEVPMGTMATQP